MLSVPIPSKFLLNFRNFIGFTLQLLFLNVILRIYWFFRCLHRSCFVKWETRKMSTFSRFQFQIETFIEFFMNLWEIYRIQTCPKLLNIISFHEFISFLGVIESRSCFEKWCRWRKGWNRQIVFFRWCHGHRWFSQVDFRSKRYEIVETVCLIHNSILKFFTGP